LISETVKILLVLDVPSLDLFLPLLLLFQKLHLHASILLLVAASTQKMLSIGRTRSIGRTYFGRQSEVRASELMRILTVRVQRSSVFCQPFVQTFLAKSMRRIFLSVLEGSLRGHSLFFVIVAVKDCFLNVQPSGPFRIRSSNSTKYFSLYLVFVIFTVRTLSSVRLELSFAFVFLGHKGDAQKRTLRISLLEGTSHSFPPNFEQCGSDLETEGIRMLHRNKN
jgi:hypothetical protein